MLVTTAMSSGGSIAIECTCGRRGFIAARLAGRKVKCTGCGQPVRVPAASASGEAESIAPAEPVAAPRSAPTPSSHGLELMPEVTRPSFHEPVITRQRRAPAGADDEPRPRRAASGHRRDTDWERHVRAIALWPMISGVLGFVAILIGSLVLLGAQTPLAWVALAFLGMSASSGLQLAYGYFLWTYHDVARLLHLVVNGLLTGLGLVSLVSTPGMLLKAMILLQLAWPAAMFVVLLDPRAATICSASYRTLVARTPRVTVGWWSSPFFYLPIVLVALCLLAIFGLAASLRMAM